MAWRHITVPLTQGRDGGSSDFAVVPATQDLLAATNVVYTQKGSIRGRPGTVSLDGAVTMFDGSSSGGSLSTPLGTYQAAGIHASGSDIILQCHGRLFKKTTSGGWSDVGPCWSVKRTTFASMSGVTGSATATTNSLAIDMGSSIAAYNVGIGAPYTGGGFPAYDTNGTIKGAWSAAANWTFTQLTASCVANNAVFWAGQGADLGKIFGYFPGTFPTGAQVTLDTGATTTALTVDTAQRLWAAYDGTNYYVAFTTGTAPTQSIKIIKVSAAGSVLGSMSYALSTTIYSLSLAVDGVNNRGLLLATCSGTTLGAKSRVFTLSTLTDNAINVDLTPSETTFWGDGRWALGATCCITGGTAYIMWNASYQSSGGGRCSIDIYTRSMTAATSVFQCTYLGSDSAYVGWQVMFQPQVVAGRVLLGIQRVNNINSGDLRSCGPATWLVVDITTGPFGLGSHRLPVPVAAGEVGSAVRAYRCASAAVVSGSLLFAAVEGVSFSTYDIEKASIHPILLTPQAAPSVRVNNYTILGGSVNYLYDGQTCQDAQWPEGIPIIGQAYQDGFAGMFSSSGGSMSASSSYSAKAVWIFIDSQGHITRSNPSPLATGATTGTNKQLSVNITTPQVNIKSEFYNGAHAVAVELYMAGPNPAATAPLYLQKTIPVGDWGPGTSFVSTTITADPITGTAQLYTTGGVLVDDPSPGDRGCVVVDNRLWTADERYLYPSHTINTVAAPATNLEEFPILVPPAFGRIQGLAAIDDKVVAVCDNGVLAVNGPGLDDTGSGQGWSEPERVSMIGSAGPARSVCSHPDGGAYIGTDGVLYGISRSLAVQPLGMAVRDVAEAGCDLVFVPPAQNIGWDSSSNPLLVYGTSNLKVLDLTNGQWALWTGLTAISLAGGASGLLAMTAGSPYVSQFSASGGLDLGVAFSMSIRLRPQETSQENLMSGWGRVRTVNPVFKTLGAHTISVQVYADEELVKIMDKSFSVPG